MKILSFVLNEGHYAIPMADIIEVNRVAVVRTIPKAPTYVIGLINLHGDIVPVLNLKRVLRITPFRLESHSMWIAVNHKSLVVCLAVDRLDRILEVRREALAEMPKHTKGPETRYLKCCAEIDNTIVPVLAVEYLLNEKENEALAEILNDNSRDVCKINGGCPGQCH